MPQLRTGSKTLVVSCLALGSILPAILYWGFVGRVPHVTPEEAQKLLDRSEAMLVDVRPPEEFAAGHLPGAINWPYSLILERQDLPREFNRKRAIMVCETGVVSAWAADNAMRYIDSENLEGGMQAWHGAMPTGFRASPRHEQAAAILSFFGFKTIYMLVAAAIVLVLWRSTSADLVAVRWSMITFLIGEIFCYWNVFAYQDRSRLLEYLHSLGMVFSFGFLTYGVLEFFDLRLIHYSDGDAKCAATALCRGCIKHDADFACGLRRLFLLLIPAAILVSFIPMFVPFSTIAYNTSIMGKPFSYAHPVTQQVYEFRYLPAIAILFFLASLISLWRVERHPAPLSKILFSIGMGALGFGLFRMILFTPFTQNQVWYNFWEEGTELIYVGALAGMLWIFRRGLGLSLPAEQTLAEQPAHAG